MMRADHGSSSAAPGHSESRRGARKHAGAADYGAAEYLYDARQTAQAHLADGAVAHLEEHFCQKLLGIPLAGDACDSARAAADRNVREPVGLRPAQEYEAWLEEMRIMRDGKRTARAGHPSGVA